VQKSEALSETSVLAEEDGEDDDLGSNLEIEDSEEESTPAVGEKRRRDQDDNSHKGSKRQKI